MTAKVSYELLHLNRQLCFALYAATRSIIKAYGKKLGPLGLTYPQYLVLVVLWEEDGLTLREIGNRLMLDSGTLTPLIRRMEAAGLVSKVGGSRRDGRKLEIKLTRRGRRLQRSAFDARDYIVCRLKATETEIAKLRAEIMHVIDALEDGSESDQVAQVSNARTAG